MPKETVDPNSKPLLFVRNTTTSEQVSELMQDLCALTKPHSTFLGQRFALHPFDNADEVEYLARKYRASLLGIGSHSKKRANNLTFVRMFDNTVLDMLELTAENYFPTSIFEGVKAATGHKPAILFIGEAFHSNERYIQASNMLLDVFRGFVPDAIDLRGLETVIAFHSHTDNSSSVGQEGNNNDKLTMRVYSVILMNATDSKLPYVTLKDMGPFVDLKIGRIQFAPEERRKEALKVPKEKMIKKEKNIEFNPMGDKLGRIHMQKQDFSKLQTRKVKALKKNPQTNENPESSNIEDREE